MKIMLAWTIEPGRYEETVKRFLEGKEEFPKGMKLAGRWHAASYGWALVEADNLPAVYRYTRQWQPTIRFVATPVMDDAETAAILK